MKRAHEMGEGGGEPLPPRLGDGSGSRAELVRAFLRGRNGPAEQPSWDRLVERLAGREARLRTHVALAAVGGALASALALSLVWPRPPAEAPPAAPAPSRSQVRGGAGAEAGAPASRPLAAMRPPGTPEAPPLAAASFEAPPGASVPRPGEGAAPEPTGTDPPAPRPVGSRRFRVVVAPYRAATADGAAAAAPVAPAPTPPAGGLDAEVALYEAARARRDAAAALEAFLEHRRRFPGGVLHREVDLSIVELLPKVGRHREALDESAALLAARPGERAGDLRLLRGNIYREVFRDYARAEAEYAGVVGSAAIADDAGFWRGVCLEQLGRPAEAAAAYRAVLVSGPAGPRAAEARRRLDAIAREHAEGSRL